MNDQGKQNWPFWATQQLQREIISEVENKTNFLGIFLFSNALDF